MPGRSASPTPNRAATAGGREGREDRLRAVPRSRQAQEVEECPHRAGPRRPHPGDVARNASRRGEHRLDGGPANVEARGEHQDVGRLQVPMLVEEREQAVVQDLGLAHRGVTDVDLKRIVRRRRIFAVPRIFNRPGPRRIFAERGDRWPFRLGRPTSEAQFEDVALHRGEPVGTCGRHEVLLPLRVRELDEGVEHVASRPSPRGEQLVAFGQVARIRIGAVGAVVDLAPRVDVAPVLPARVEEEQVDLDALRRQAQQFQVGRREALHRKEAGAPRPAGRVAGAGRRRRRVTRSMDCGRRRDFRRQRRIGHPDGRGIPRVASAMRAAEGVTELVERPDPVLGAAGTVRLHEALPQPRLPVRCRPALPLPDPVRTVVEAPVVDPGKAVGELEPLAGVAIPEIALKCSLPRARSPVRLLRSLRVSRAMSGRRARSRRIGAIRQEVQNAPPEPRRRVGLLGGEIRHDASHD